jgi:hypothetical protein
MRFSRSIAHRSGISLGKEPKKGIFPRRFVGVFQYRDPTLKEFQGTLNEWLKLLRSHYKV